MTNENNYKVFLGIFILLLTWFSFFLGFYLDENSSGAGSYDGDWNYTWTNLKIFLNNDILTAIEHENYLTNRTPLSYLLHKFFNPFVESKINFRRTVFFLSLTVPIIFYLFLRMKYQKIDSLTLFLISSSILLSPYFRTSSFWGMEENYAFISLLLSAIFLNLTLEKNKKQSINFINLFLCVTFSSLCIYFDQKLLIVPIICYLSILKSEKRIKILCTFLYFVMSLPYMYLIYTWGGIFPTTLTEARNLGNVIYLDHLGYASTIIAFYLLPILFFKSDKISEMLKNFFKEKENYYLAIIFLFYVFYLIITSSLVGKDLINVNTLLGKGYVHKISLILFENLLIRKIFIYISFIASFLIIILFTQKNLKDKLILLYFLIIPIFTNPLMQEYFDPTILILVFTFFSTKLLLNFRNAVILYVYLSALCIGSNIYYYNLFN
tara:strand:- start:5258 stop:6568 length:1311 start_codon:yes stop_codon:yes gene_type:complete